MNDERNLDSLLKQMAEEDTAELPSPGLIWWRAQILRKQREKERIEQPLIIMRWLAAVVCAAAAVMLAGNWGVLHTAIADNYRWLLALAIVVVTMSVVLVVALLWSPASKA